jgi:hypothetical protein
VQNPDDPMPPAGLRKFDDSTLRDCFTLEPGTAEGVRLPGAQLDLGRASHAVQFDQQEWYRTGARTIVALSVSC